MSSPTSPRPSREYLFKILVIGDLGTGKTSIIKRYVHNMFSMHYKSTIGVDFALKVLHLDNNVVVRLQLWDIAGQERFGSMTRVYYKDAVGALLVFDVTRMSTFDAVSKWKADLDDKVRLANRQPIPVVLLANKVDLEREQVVRNTNGQLDAFCKQNGFARWFETSAKENAGVDDACKFLVNLVIENTNRIERELGSETANGKRSTTIDLSADNQVPKNSSCCASI